MKIPSHLDGLSKRDLIRYIVSLEARFEEQQKEIEALKHYLLAYENPHTPPSQQRRYPKQKSSGGKVGAPKGHKGVTRETPKPNRFKVLKLKICPDCGKKLGRPSHTQKKIIEDIPEPQPTNITEFTIPHYFCNHCNKKVIPTDPGLPSEGRFGPNIQAQITLMKYEDRLPHRKLAQTLNRQYKLKLTPATILDITRRVSDKLQRVYETIKQQVQKSEVVNADETGQKVQGKKWWNWVFITTTTILFLLRPSRGQKVIKEALGNNYQGKLGCDGWTSYPKCVKLLQRCWAHLLREAKWLAQQHKGQAQITYKELCGIYKKIKNLRKKELKQTTREKHYNKLTKQIQTIINRIMAYTHLRKFAGKIENGLNHWFTCVLHPEIEPTNNTAERALRELIVQRKITGTLRNTKGTKITETVMSVLATWKLQKLNTYNQLKICLS